MSSEPNVAATPEALVARLGAAGTTLALAESCTGGLVAARLTAVPGASRVLWGCAVVYTAAAKRELLGLDRRLLEAHGTVSPAVTRALASAARTRSGADLGAAVTGWAGPEAKAPDPVGTVYLAVAGADGVDLRELHLQGSRAAVRGGAATALLEWILDRHGTWETVA